LKTLEDSGSIDRANVTGPLFSFRDDRNLNNIRSVTEGLFQKFCQHGICFNQKRPRNRMLRCESGEKFSAMRAKVRDRSWSRQERRKKRMLSKTSNSQPAEKAMKHALKHGSHMRAKPIFEAGESRSKRIARRFFQSARL